MHRWNDPHEGGTKCSIVLFRSDKKPKSNVMNEARLKKIAQEKAEKAKVVSESSHLFSESPNASPDFEHHQQQQEASRP